MTSATKGIISLLSIGGAGAVGTGIYLTDPFKTKKVEINALIKKQELFTLLKGEDSKWTEAWKNYQTKNKGKSKGQDTWKLSDWTGDNSSIGVSFKTECNNRLSLRVNGEEDPLFQEFKDLCMRKTTVSDKLEKEGYTALDTSDTNADNSTWTTNFTNYQSAKPEEKVKGIEITSGASHGDSRSLTKFKNDCKAAIAKAINEVSYTNTKKWCSKKK